MSDVWLACDKEDNIVILVNGECIKTFDFIMIVTTANSHRLLLNESTTLIINEIFLFNFAVSLIE